MPRALISSQSRALQKLPRLHPATGPSGQGVTSDQLQTGASEAASTHNTLRKSGSSPRRVTACRTFGVRVLDPEADGSSPSKITPASNRGGFETAASQRSRKARKVRVARKQEPDLGAEDLKPQQVSA